MPLEPGVSIHADAMASHFGQKHKKTKQPGSTLPSPMFFFGGVQWDAFHWGWQFVVRDSRLHLSENVVGTLFSGGGSLSVVRDSRLHPTENAVSPRVFFFVFFFGGGEGEGTPLRAPERQMRQGHGTAEP